MNPDPVLFCLPPAADSPRRVHDTLDIVLAADAAVRTARLTGPADAWVGRLGPPFRREVVPLCCTSAAFMAPWLSTAGLRTTAHTLQLVFALDAATDLPAPDAPVAAQLDLLHRVAHGAPTPDRAPLATALAEIRAAVTGMRWGKELLPRWEQAADATLTGTGFEFDAARTLALGGPLPPLADYLRHAADSTAFDLVSLALWADMDDADVPAAAERLQGPLADGAVALRAANDLRGHVREQTEGSLDALALGLSPRQLGDLLSTHLTRFREALRPFTAAGFGPAIATERLLLWCVRYYQHTDAGHDDADHDDHDHDDVGLGVPVTAESAGDGVGRTR
ncbi:hypothetical protein [Streptomyces sp. NPDC048282]|uniref:hypothetical protein n=1 Tax=Streptomyces sp. NPDC048282 TaxID=3365528 RepID=UPI0037192E25